MAGNPITNAISGAGTFFHLPDLGVGAAGGNGAPGALQGQNPMTYAGVPVTNNNNAAVLPATTPQQAAGLAAPSGTPPGTNQNPAPSGGTAGTQPAPNPLIGTLLNNVQSLLGQYNDYYNTLYGNGQPGQGVYGQGVQNSINALQAQYLPNFGQIANQAQTGSHALDWQNLANGTGASSFAGQEQQDLANNAANAGAGLAASEQSQMQNAATNAAQTIGSANTQKTLNNQQVQLLQNTYGNPQGAADPMAAYEINNTIGQFTNPQGLPAMAGQIASAQNPQALAGELGTIAPNQILSPQNIQGALAGNGQSTLPSYLQNILSNALTGVNTQAAPNSYWGSYLKSLMPS